MSWAGVRALGVLVLWVAGGIGAVVAVVIVADDDVAALGALGALLVVVGTAMGLYGVFELLVTHSTSEVRSAWLLPWVWLRAQVARRWDVLLRQLGRRPTTTHPITAAGVSASAASLRADVPPRRPADGADPGEWYRYLEARLDDERLERERVVIELRAADVAHAKRLKEVADGLDQQRVQLEEVRESEFGEDALAWTFWALWLIVVGTLLQAAAAAWG